MIRNYLTGIVRDALGPLFTPLYGQDPKKEEIKIARAYREGEQPKTLKFKAGQSDDNITVNFSGLLVDRAISLLFGDEVGFDLPDQAGQKDAEGEGEESDQDKYLTKVWDLNKKDELLSDLADFGATSGTPVIQFIPDGITDEEDGKTYPQLVVVDPAWVTIKTEPENYKNVNGYDIEYMIKGEDGRTRRRLREVRPVYKESDTTDAKVIESWKIEDYIENDAGNMVLMPDTQIEWGYTWPPYYHFKNLPKAGSQTGRPDLTKDLMHLNDKINLVFSNANKVIRLQAHKTLWGRLLGDMGVIDTGPGKVLNINNKDGHLAAIEAGDADPITAFGRELREALFTIGRSTDPQSIKDKVGQITNFGLRVLYKDAIDKLKTKRKLYGEALKYINKRILLMGGYTGALADPGQIKWPEALPSDISEVIKGQEFELKYNIASVETIRQERGRDNADETKRIEQEKAQNEAESDNIGKDLLLNFNKSRPRNLLTLSTARTAADNQK